MNGEVIIGIPSNHKERQQLQGSEESRLSISCNEFRSRNSIFLTAKYDKICIPCTSLSFKA